ncbi:MAG: MotA/TolQ/ExbB proton channel family protein [Sedimentisphaerales bacterium]|nr:MotA/TolQ/ExbB proton channel family protein [Sedimentisphaerales bacterium]
MSQCFCRIRTRRVFGSAAALAALAWLAPESASATPAALLAAEQRISLWSTIAAGGVIGYLILLMSLVALAFVIEHFLTIRRERLLPAQLIADLEELVHNRQYEQAKQRCGRDGSYLAQVVGAGLNQMGSMFGFFDMQNTMQETSEREISRLNRKLEYLAFIASSAPMMGLLGTVTGMIRAFNKIAETEGAARPSELAGGISEALVTTCLGLVVAIPTMFCVAVFRSRIESYVSEAESVVEKLMGRFRREQTA